MREALNLLKLFALIASAWFVAGLFLYVVIAAAGFLG